MTTVLDSSAIMAVINREGGAELVRSAPRPMVSAVNVAEVFTKLAEAGYSRSAAEQTWSGLAFRSVPFDEHLAADTGLLRSKTRDRGLSLGDRACLALARREKAPVLTSDRKWAEVEVGVEVRLIR